jgi:hypothetical protein
MNKSERPNEKYTDFPYMYQNQPNRETQHVILYPPDPSFRAPEPLKGSKMFQSVTPPPIERAKARLKV